MDHQAFNSKDLGRYRDYGYSTSEGPHTESYLLPGLQVVIDRLGPRSFVLEAGCGNGWFSEHLHSYGLRVSAFDLSASGIDRASHRNSEIDFKVASVYDDLLALFGRRFAAVFSLEVIEHLYDPRVHVKRAYEVLEEGGLFVITTPYHGYFKNLLMAVTGKMDSHFTALWDGGHIKFWSRRTLTALLSEAGFDVIEFRGSGRVPYLWKSMILVARRRG